MAGEMDDFFDFEYEAGVVIAKKRKGQFKIKDNRDNLPFDVFLERKRSQKKSTKLGTYLLHSFCENGDIIVLAKKTYSVKRVAFLYKWAFAGLSVIKKKIDEVEERGNLLADEDASEVLSEFTHSWFTSHRYLFRLST